MTDMPTTTTRSNLPIVGLCMVFTAAMLGASFAAVPLYRLFCQVTGYGGTTQRVEQYSDRILERSVTIRFDANTAGVPWDFQPVAREMTIKIGATAEAHYRAVNLSSRPASGRATFNVTPELAGAYFNKVECFCFTDTELQPGETLDMPVVFYVDPDIVDVAELANLKTITLSYTFFPNEGTLPVAAGTAGDKPTFDGNNGG